MGKNLAFSALLDVYGRFLSDKQRSLAEHYYNEDLSLSEIAENENITRQGVRDAILRAENILREMEEKLGLYERFAVIGEGLEKIAALAGEIKRINSEKYFSREIDDLAREITGVTLDLWEDEGGEDDEEYED